jgi:long-chain acyl-CoA synthetase
MEKRFERFGYILPGENKIESEHVRNRIQKEVDKVNKKLPHWEKIKKFVLLEEPFTIEKGELTAKMSIKRAGVMKNHKELIESIYQD